MKTLKYSRQRESIKANLMNRTDHPTADALYLSIREEFPNISLGTVYRNLNLLVELGEIIKFSAGDGSYVAYVGTPVVDGMGSEGEFSHTVEEYVRVDTLMQRLQTCIDLIASIMK